MQSVWIERLKGLVGERQGFDPELAHVTGNSVAVVYISFVALVQQDMKKLIAYSSIAHMGFVTLGFFIVFMIAGNTGSFKGAVMGIEGGMVQMVSHGFISGAMFLCVGVLYDRMHSRQISDYGEVVNTMPKFAAFMVLFAMSNAGLPGTSGFVGEFMVILSAFKANFWIAFFAATTLILGAAYTLWMVKRVIYGKVSHHHVGGAVVMSDDLETRYVVEAGFGWAAEFLKREVGLDERTWAAWVLRSAEEAYLLESLSGDATRLPVLVLVEASGRAESLLAVPLRARGRTLGALVLTAGRGSFDASSRRVLEILANQAAATIQLIKDKEQQRQLAVRDGLTGLYNRRAFSELLGAAIANEDRRPSGSLGLVFTKESSQTSQELQSLL